MFKNVLLLKLSRILIIIIMLPFQNNLSQYIADLYASSSYYQPVYYYSGNQREWNNVHYDEQNMPAPQIAVVKEEQPQKNQQTTKTKEKTKRGKEKTGLESSASCQSADQDSEKTPDFKNRQKYGRNITSNIFHQMLKAIKSDEIFEQILGKIFKSRQYVITKELFYEMFNKRVGRLNPYVSTTKMNSFFNGITKYKYSKAREWKGVEREYMSLLRILSRYYLTKIHILCVFNKLRMQNLSRKFHIQGIRKILEVITR